ncbi:ATPase, P-type (Transporting), HAD superfamily, subfamily IC [Richelia sinica FACHB-800]|uniref:ATPase, P-type (Transporting), HAD superfamily, subfamily IC n=1 Tax=Richelia sinica FACHB-800 TaxID=1357546 RepID=A0A975T5W0_9NOST|nr:cation-transporting P-type ATPase [Richelia sinica]MBD2664295.1 cation-transporting P-type ATPase [Richelia sinica FACHB-800]QXE22475.1 ATPase, P-type (Transporting), HAD superfamily, subfamily IC [Richelia sinica FACHB-800]
MNSNFHIWTLTPPDVYKTLATTPQGISETEASLRLKQFGYNELPEPQTRPLILRFIDQLTHFMALLLWVAGILAFISQTPELGWAIWAVIWINAIFSFWQEYQAEKALSALKKILPSQAKVYRDGKLSVIAARELVSGDVMQLEEGDKISADARLIESQSLYVDVSVLTGESLPVPRISQPVTAANIHASDASNLVFAGSTVAAGRGLAVVYATGTHTEFGQVAHLTAHVQREASTLEVQISRVVHIITIIALSMGVVIFLLTKLLVGMQLRESFIFAIGIIVAFVPEGLLPTVSLALAIGVRRMATKNALVRRLSAVETLSATTVICTDKTGTLTKNEMTVRQLWIPNTQINVTGVGYEPKGEVEITSSEYQSQVRLMLAGAALCSNARLNHPPNSNQWQAVGDPTEAALLVAAIKAGLKLEELQHQAPRVREIPFDSHRRMMTVLLSGNLQLDNVENCEYLIFTKGAPLDVLQHSRYLWHSGENLELTETQREEIVAANDQLASQGYRVLGVAIRQGRTELNQADNNLLEQDLTFLGLVAMIDPPRPEVADAIALCHRADIQVTMITGDYGLTAAAIAQRIGLGNGKPRIITGEQLGHLSDTQLRQILHKHKTGLVFARVIPEQKLRLVEAYKTLGNIVAVTGDGVNDAPALRAANIGIAMGISGTDVAREAADIVLIDDNFATIVAAIEQGRAVYQNIRKFMTYILASNMAEFLPFLAMVFLKIPPALVILQILAIDLGTDMLPALALGAEKPEAGAMELPPRKKSQPLLDLPLLLRAYCFLGLLEGLAGMAGFFLVWWTNGYNLSQLQAFSPSILSHSANATTMAIYHQATTMTLAVIVACQDGNVFACRSERFSILRLGFFTNRLIWIGIAVEWFLILSIIYSPTLQKIFSTAPLKPSYWLILLLCPPLILIADELRKRIIVQINRDKVQNSNG